jgi:prepilin-type processing-associated H-X9-DG protein
LVELLVVITIIVMLAALLLPAFAQAGARAKSIQCLSNLRQMGIAAHIYLDDNADFYPIAYWGDDEGNSYCWDLNVLYDANGNATVQPGILWERQGNAQVQQCPAYTGSANWADNPYTGYNYNTSYLGHGQGEDLPQPAKNSAVRNPVKTVIFGDGQYAGGADKFMRAPFPNPGDASFDGRFAGTQGFRHRHRSNAVFCDGHAESLRDCCTNYSETVPLAPGTGFLSVSNSLYDLN